MNSLTLSSRQTFVMKFVFPAFWITIFGFGTVMLWSGAMHGKGGAPPPPEMKYLFLAVWFAGTSFILWLCTPLKRVRVDDRSIHISNYRREISVPLGAIDRVTENRWVNIHPVTIHFRTPTEFGDRVTFIPKARMFGFLSSHPVVAELRTLASTPPGQRDRFQRKP